MNYTILSDATTPNNRYLEIVQDENGKTYFALHIDTDTLYRGNRLLPVYNQPRAQIIFSERLEILLLADAKRGEELDDYDQKYAVTLYTKGEYNRKLNGYTPIALNK